MNKKFLSVAVAGALAASRLGSSQAAGRDILPIKTCDPEDRRKKRGLNGEGLPVIENATATLTIGDTGKYLLVGGTVEVAAVLATNARPVDTSDIVTDNGANWMPDDLGEADVMPTGLVAPASAQSRDYDVPSTMTIGGGHSSIGLGDPAKFKQMGAGDTTIAGISIGGGSSNLADRETVDLMGPVVIGLVAHDKTARNSMAYGGGAARQNPLQ